MKLPRTAASHTRAAPPFAPEVVSTGVEHSAAVFTPDGNEVRFGRMFLAAIYYMEQRGERWMAPRTVPFGTESGEHYPYLTTDGQHLFFTTGRSLSPGAEPIGRSGHPVNLGRTINSPYKDEYPYITPDGKHLFFNSNQPSELNEKPIPDGPGNIYWVDSAVVQELRP